MELCDSSAPTGDLKRPPPKITLSVGRTALTSLPGCARALACGRPFPSRRAARILSSQGVQAPVLFSAIAESALALEEPVLPQSLHNLLWSFARQAYAHDRLFQRMIKPCIVPRPALSIPLPWLLPHGTAQSSCAGLLSHFPTCHSACCYPTFATTGCSR